MKCEYNTQVKYSFDYSSMIVIFQFITYILRAQCKQGAGEIFIQSNVYSFQFFRVFESRFVKIKIF